MLEGRTDVFYGARVRLVSLPSFDFFIFSDASFDSDSGVGMGAILRLRKTDWRNPVETTDLPIQTMVFRAKNIARLELVTVLWALENFVSERKAELPGSVPPPICLITDCKTIGDLPQRRRKLEAGNFQSKPTSLTLANADLYRKFFGAYDKLHPTVIWTRGHSPSGKCWELQQIFARVDSAARQALRKYLKGRDATSER